MSKLWFGNGYENGKERCSCRQTILGVQFISKMQGNYFNFLNQKWLEIHETRGLIVHRPGPKNDVIDRFQREKLVGPVGLEPTTNGL